MQFRNIIIYYYNMSERVNVDERKKNTTEQDGGPNIASNAVFSKNGYRWRYHILYRDRRNVAHYFEL